MKPQNDLVLRPLFLSLAAVLVFITGEIAFAQTNRAITPNSAGNVRIGMTVNQARATMRGYTFRRTTDGEGAALIEISRRGRAHMTVYAGEFDAGQPINGDAKIEYIEVWDSNYQTSRGVRPGTRVRDAESQYGKISSIMLSEIEAREFARFTSQPEGIDFRLRNRNGMAGVYASGQTVTTRYSPNAYILSVIVLGGTDDVGAGTGSGTGNGTNNGAGTETTNANYTSQYTDLRTQCQTPRNQGGSGHISTYCRGVGGYQIHIFDTATTMEINVQSTDRQRSIHLASQSLSFNRNNSRVEWRIRDGKPFAVIMRASKYQLGEDGLIRYPEVKTGEYLVVKGLPGYEHINYEVDTRRERNANEKARQMADTGFSGNSNGDTNANAAYQNLNINRFNRLIDIGVRGRQAWVKSPMQVVARLVGEMRDTKTRAIRFISPNAEGSDSLTVVVTDSGLLDDSIFAERMRLELRKNSGGVWKVISGQRAWRCQQGRGHQKFNATPCN